MEPIPRLSTSREAPQYVELLLAGHEIADPPSAEDFIAQLEHSISRIVSDCGTDCLYDRCPTDFLAYLAGRYFETREWVSAAHQALSKFDLIVFVPIEHPDRINTGSTILDNELALTSCEVTSTPKRSTR